jgi:uncharacterized repeat protein (TIGR03943 family)
MSREAENVLLLLVGIATAMITIGGAYTRYVKPSLMPFLAVTAVLVIGLALVAIATDIRRGSAAEHDHGDGHVHTGSVAWMLIVPVVVLIFVTPPALRPQAAAPKVTSVSTEVLRRPFPALPAGQAPEVSIPDVMMRAAQDSAGTLNDRLITVIGFTMPTDDGVDLARVMLICCAADAQLARVHLDGPAAAELRSYPEQTWLKVEGIVVTGEADGDSTSVPTMKVQTATRIDAPANVYA